jgi:hypothetical protein
MQLSLYTQYHIMIVIKMEIHPARGSHMMWGKMGSAQFRLPAREAAA